MCAQCVAQGAAYVVPGLAALKVWARRRPKPSISIEDPIDQDAAASKGWPQAHV